MSTGVFGVAAPHPPIFVPAVGGAQANVARASLDALAVARDALAVFAPQTIVLMSPHAPAAYDCFLVDGSARLSGSLAQFGDAEVHSWPGDPDFAAALIGAMAAADIPVASRRDDPRLHEGSLDHATIVPMSFLEPTHSVALVVLSLSYRDYAEHRRVGQLVSQTAATLGRRVAFVASGDMSHRLTHDAAAGYSPRAAELDAAIVQLVADGRLEGLMALDPELIDAGGECGLRSLIALGGFAGDDPVPTAVLAYEGPWGVGYLTALVGDAAVAGLANADGAITATHATPTPPAGRKGGMAGHDDSEIVRLARATIESWVRTGSAPHPTPLEGAEYPQVAGAFVSLHRDGMLRGCIGTIGPTQLTLAEEVASNAVQAATEDPRFNPLTPAELADLDIKVDVLHAPETCSLADLDPARFGVIVTDGHRRGLLLPDLEGVDDVTSQVAIAMQKAGIAPNSRCELQRFKVDRYT
jgi:AmmeMemoRadiSam system protein A